MTTETNDWCLYVFVKTNLASMNPGKAQAHSGHAANAFIYKNYIGMDSASKTRQCVEEWMVSTSQGFGTQINLKSEDWDADMETLTRFAGMYQYPFEEIVDPTYPFEVTPEVFDMLEDRFKQDAIHKGDKVICFRREVTAAYIFGRRSDKVLSNALSKFKLHP